MVAVCLTHRHWAHAFSQSEALSLSSLQPASTILQTVTEWWRIHDDIPYLYDIPFAEFTIPLVSHEIFLWLAQPYLPIVSYFRCAGQRDCREVPVFARQIISWNCASLWAVDSSQRHSPVHRSGNVTAWPIDGCFSWKDQRGVERQEGIGKVLLTVGREACVGQARHRFKTWACSGTFKSFPYHSQSLDCLSVVYRGWNSVVECGVWRCKCKCMWRLLFFARPVACLW